MRKVVFLPLIMVALMQMLISCGNQKQTDAEDNFEVVADTMDSKVTPKILGTITDYEKLFTEGESKTLAARCADFEKKNAIPIGVFTSENIGDYNNFTEYADAVSEKWNGCKDNQGLLFVISNKLGEIRMISCPATENRISDKDFDYVINTVIFDSFRKNQFFDGIINALEYLDLKIKKQ
ncbi:MAG: hypothetical protein A2W93_11240 [Bacteroidetes bacterium GWF2_43_63]|nr:MAG: hypothetical protein A2W94_14115 [Bacteroidetes bacterium GWE2_42_42]OFY54848.1 MAG: hypothetical protein A2W93_11240 [Bacteroidetes bacterium GWF2_43_63]HCB63249.1 hypothetical protein [Bacteroidales bacterium]HCY21991.1 hypothetical protein [Bacteroidales bacterium]